MLKKSLTLLLILLPMFAFAHGGVEKHAGNVIVFLKQTPLSPLVSEKVDFSFSFSDRNFNKVFSNMPVTLILSDTFPGDESKDTVVLTKELATDVNGNIDFSYAFNKENYFDIDLDFIDPSTGKKEEVGFLVQPRTRSDRAITFSPFIYSLVGFFLGGSVFGLVLKNLKKRLFVS
jgi:hypothetical protein